MIFSMIGELSHAKGVHVLVESILKMSFIQGVEYHFVGSSTNDGADAFPLVEDLCKRRGDVKYHGYIDDMKNYLGGVNVVISCIANNIN